MNAVSVLIPPVVACVVLGERLREVRTRRETVAGKVAEVKTFRGFMLCGVLSIVCGVTEYELRGGRIHWALLALGVAVSIASFALRRAAIRALGRFWSLHVEMREGHEFVTSGPFKYLRHPVYFSMYLELLGIALILVSPVTFVLVMLLFIPTLHRRLTLEEAALEEKFGAAYVEYRKTTPAVFPVRLPTSGGRG